MKKNVKNTAKKNVKGNVLYSVVLQINGYDGIEYIDRIGTYHTIKQSVDLLNNIVSYFNEQGFNFKKDEKTKEYYTNEFDGVIGAYLYIDKHFVKSPKKVSENIQKALKELERCAVDPDEVLKEIAEAGEGNKEEAQEEIQE